MEKYPKPEPVDDCVPKLAEFLLNSCGKTQKGFQVFTLPMDKEISKDHLSQIKSLLAKYCGRKDDQESLDAFTQEDLNAFFIWLFSTNKNTLDNTGIRIRDSKEILLLYRQDRTETASEIGQMAPEPAKQRRLSDQQAAEMERLKNKHECLLKEYDNVVSINNIDADQVNVVYDKYMDLLHEYNEIRDTGTYVLGKLAQFKGVSAKEMYIEYNMDKDD